MPGLKEVKKVDTSNPTLLNKHVSVIHSSGEITLLQRKIANGLLYYAYNDLLTKDEHQISIRDLCNLIGYKSNDYKTIKNALRKLMLTIVEWNLMDGSKEIGWEASTMIAHASIEGSICTYSYSSFMKKKLFKPKMYGRIDLAVQAKFQSMYGLALYENCNRYQAIGMTPWFELEKFKKLLGVSLIKYKKFTDFRKNVLDKAIAEVNKYSTLEISPQVRKQNRQVVSIQFLINKPKLSASSSSTYDNPVQREIAGVLKEKFGLSAKQMAQVFVDYTEAYIKEKIDLVISSPSFKNGKVKNVAKYLMSALRDDYKASKSSSAIKIDLLANESKSNNIQDNESLIKFRRFHEVELFKLFEELSVRRKKNLLSKFEKYLVGSYQLIYAREGLSDILIQEQLCHFLKEINHELVGKLPSYKEWMEDISMVEIAEY